MLKSLKRKNIIETNIRDRIESKTILFIIYFLFNQNRLNYEDKARNGIKKPVHA
jgi:hypothetical protein